MSSGIFAFSRDRPDDFNRYSYFLVRLYCTGLGFQANIVEELVLLNALQHIFAGSKRTRDQKLSSGLKSGQLNLSVEEYVPLSASQHIFAGLKRTRDQKLSSGLKSGQLSSAITG